MVFTSSIFLFVFFPITLILYFNPFFRSLRYRNMILVFLSIGFYAWGEPVFVFVVLFSAFINWWLALLMEKYDKRVFAFLAVAFDVLILVVFKYLTFITEQIAWLSGRNDLVVEIALPIGISFFTFQMMSYILDIVMGKAKAQRKFQDVLLYLIMFPQLIAGPIVRYETIEQQIDCRTTDIESFGIGMCRFVKGLAKKVLIANTVALLADAVFEYEASGLSCAAAWLGAVAYTVQIYFDFSGYSDMAIGLGRIFGFRFLENFDHPYRSASITEFWRRWHISMGSWFRDYVYFPLGGSRTASVARHMLNLFVVWLLTGLWHGANWTFILWGLMYFVLLALEKLTGINRKLGKFGHIWTMFFVIIGWVLFRSETVEYALQYIGAMLGMTGAGLVGQAFWDLLGQYWSVLAIGIVLSVTDMGKLLNQILGKYKVYDVFYTAAYLLTFFVIVCAVVKGGNDPFIYFNF